MSGISYKAAGTLKKGVGFGGKELNNSEFSDGSGLEEYDFGARFYNQQIGRWHNIDALADKYMFLSPFSYTGDNPIVFYDPDGKKIRFANYNGNLNTTADKFATMLSKDFGIEKLFSIKDGGYLSIREDLTKAELVKLENNEVYKYIRDKIDSDKTVYINARNLNDNGVITYMYDDYVTNEIDYNSTSQLSDNPDNPYKGSNMFQHYLAEQWSAQIENGEKSGSCPTCYKRDHKNAKEVELETSGVKRDNALDVSMGDEDGGRLNIFAVVNKNGEVLGYTKTMYSNGKTKGYEVTFLSVEAGKKEIARLLNVFKNDKSKDIRVGE
jgi:RHS repeat-associated protein